MKLRFQMLAHVTYAVSPEQFEHLGLHDADYPIILYGQVSTPIFKSQRLREPCMSHGLMIRQEEYPTEYLAIRSAESAEQPAPLPCGGREPASGETSLRSASFTSQTLAEIGALFGQVPSKTSLTLESRATCLTLMADRAAPSFSPFLDGGPGPVSLGVFCKHLIQDEIATQFPHLETLSEIVETPAGRFTVVMVRTGEIWLELLERLERYADRP